MCAISASNDHIGRIDRLFDDMRPFIYTSNKFCGQFSCSVHVLYLVTDVRSTVGPNGSGTTFLMLTE